MPVARSADRRQARRRSRQGSRSARRARGDRRRAAALARFHVSAVPRPPLASQSRTMKREIRPFDDFLFEPDAAGPAGIAGSGDAAVTPRPLLDGTAIQRGQIGVVDLAPLLGSHTPDQWRNSSRTPFASSDTYESPMVLGMQKTFAGPLYKRLTIPPAFFPSAMIARGCS